MTPLPPATSTRIICFPHVSSWLIWSRDSAASCDVLLSLQPQSPPRARTGPDRARNLRGSDLWTSPDVASPAVRRELAMGPARPELRSGVTQACAHVACRPSD